jgi:hypothetical protein
VLIETSLRHPCLRHDVSDADGSGAAFAKRGLRDVNNALPIFFRLRAIRATHSHLQKALTIEFI